jgi:hypothetical protein
VVAIAHPMAVAAVMAVDRGKSLGGHLFFLPSSTPSLSSFAFWSHIYLVFDLFINSGLIQNVLGQTTPIWTRPEDSWNPSSTSMETASAGEISLPWLALPVLNTWVLQHWAFALVALT